MDYIDTVTTPLVFIIDFEQVFVRKYKDNYLINLASDLQFIWWEKRRSRPQLIHITPRCNKNLK